MPLNSSTGSLSYLLHLKHLPLGYPSQLQPHAIRSATNKSHTVDSHNEPDLVLWPQAHPGSKLRLENMALEHGDPPTSGLSVCLLLCYEAFWSPTSIRDARRARPHFLLLPPPLSPLCITRSLALSRKRQRAKREA